MLWIRRDYEPQHIYISGMLSPITNRSRQSVKVKPMQYEKGRYGGPVDNYMPVCIIFQVWPLVQPRVFPCFPCTFDKAF